MPDSRLSPAQERALREIEKDGVISAINHEAIPGLREAGLIETSSAHPPRLTPAGVEALARSNDGD